MPVTCLVSTHFCFCEWPGITAAVELRFMSCMHLSCLPWAGVRISWVWKPSTAAALMVQIEFPWYLAGCFSPLHCIRVMFFRSLYYHIQNSTYHKIQLCTVFTVNVAFLSAIQTIVSPVLVSEEAVWQTRYRGAGGYSIRCAMEWSSGTCSSPLHTVCCYRATIQQEPSRAASRTTRK